MLLSYRANLNPNQPEPRLEVEAEVTTGHPASSCGQPVVVLPDGGALDLTSWTLLDYRIEAVTEDERTAMAAAGY